MDRRKFLDLGVFVSTSSLLRSGVIGGTLAYLGYSGARAMMKSDVLFQQLLSFQSFREIDKILASLNKPYLLNRSVEDLTSPRAVFPIITEKIALSVINRTHGRLANFRSEESEPSSAFVITQGNAGRRLREQTELKVISRYSPALSTKTYFADAFPHHFNSFAVNGPKWFREYWIDARTRSPIHLHLEIAAGISESHRVEIAALSQGLQTQLEKVDAAALEKLGDKYPIKLFDPLILNSMKKVSLTTA